MGIVFRMYSLFFCIPVPIVLPFFDFNVHASLANATDPTPVSNLGIESSEFMASGACITSFKV